MAEGNLPPASDPGPDPVPGAAIPRNPLDHDAAVAARQPAGSAKPPAPKPGRRKRRRRWPFVVLGLVLLLGLLVLLAPTLAGTAPGRSLIVGQVNQRINGRLELGELSLGWATPVRVGGLKLFDKSGVLILELPRLTTELSLMDAARGSLHFGKVTVEGLNALVRRDPQGNINFAQLVP